MRKAFMIVHQVREPVPMPIRVLSEFEHLTQNQQQQKKLAKIFLYTKTSVYEGILTKIDINTQLSWNQKCIKALVQSLSGIKTNIQIRFNESNTTMDLICQIQSGINIKIFEIKLFQIPETTPLRHLKEVCMNYKNAYSEQESKAKQQKEKIMHEIKEIQALQKQIEEQTVTEIAHLKKNFIDVINQSKKQLRKHMKTGINEIVNEQQDIMQEEEAISKKRVIRRVDRNALESRANEIGNEIDKGNIIQQNHSMDILFDN